MINHAAANKPDARQVSSVKTKFVFPIPHQSLFNAVKLSARLVTIVSKENVNKFLQ